MYANSQHSKQLVGYAADAQSVRGPSSPLDSAKDRLRASVASLGNAAEVLSARLQAVLLPVPVRGVDGSAQPPMTAPVTSSLVRDIDNEAQTIDNIVAQLQDILNRLEV